MSCHQWCNCSKCSTFYDDCMNEIPNPYEGNKSMSYMENKASDQIDAGLSEKEKLLNRIEVLEAACDSLCTERNQLEVKLADTTNVKNHASAEYHTRKDTIGIVKAD